MDSATKLTQLRQASIDEIEEWAGSTILKRGQSYQRNGRVQQLAQTADGAVVAWVLGTERYATLVEYDEHGLNALCTCPYGDICKHAVAVLLAFQLSGQQRALPTADANDPRLLLLEHDPEAWDDDDLDDGPPLTDGQVPLVIPTPSQGGADLQSFLYSLSKEELIQLLEDLGERFADVKNALTARQKLASGNVGQLIRDTRRLLVKVSAREYNPWDGDALPEYSEIRDRLQLLLRQGYADEVIDIGETLLESGTEQIEQSHDEGELSGEIAACLDVVFQALPHASRPPAEQLLWAIDMALADGYDLCGGAYQFLEQAHPAAAWSTVADVLLKRLRDTPASGEDFMRSYRRERLSNWAVRALHGAGRQDEVLSLAEQEAERNGDYVRLVDLLLKTGRTDEAEHRIRQGIAALEGSKPGLSQQLRGLQRQIWEQHGDWARVAAFHAEEFFYSPAMSTLRALQHAAEQAGVWPAVRAAALHYLETGERPNAGQSTWPLPALDLPPLQRGWKLQFPQVGMLIDLARAENRPDDVLRWYDQRPTEPSGWAASDYVSINHDAVASAVAATHPDRAAAIWKRLAEQLIAQTNTRAYEEAAVFLGKLGDLMQRQGRVDEWRAYIADLREANKRKRRLLETLDALEKRQR